MFHSLKHFTFKHFTANKKLDPAVLDVLLKLNETYGERLFFLSTDTKWINFGVQGMPEEALLRKLMDQPEKFFADFSQFQVLCPSDPSHRGLFLHHLRTPALCIEYKSGFGYC